MLWLVAELITAVVGSRTLAGSDWQLAVERPIERAERLSPCHPDDGWSAVLGIRRGLKLLVTGNGQMPDLLIEAWAGQPGDSSDGVAVVDLAADGLAVARVPLPLSALGPRQVLRNLPDMAAGIGAASGAL